MKVILNQDLIGLGEEGDIKDVADGYARNFLLPKKLAVPHTKEFLASLGHKRAAIEKRKEGKRLEAASLKELIDQLDQVYAGLRTRLCEDDGNIRRFINVYVNEEDVRFLQGLATPLKAGDEVSIVPAIAGGW